MTPLRITRWRSLTDTTATSVRDVRWRSLVRWLSLTRPLHADDDRAQPGWSAAAFKPPRRAGGNVQSVSALVLDVDSGAPMAGAAEALAGILGVLVSSRKHTAACHRYRVVLAQSRPTTPAEHEHVWALLTVQLGDAGITVDPSACDAGRFWFVPSGRPVVVELPGEPLDVDAILSLPLPSAPSPAPEPPRQALGGNGAPLPGERPGDAWARTVSWDDLLLPHGWARAGRQGSQDAWRRPGKTRGISATCDGQHLYVFTSSAPPLEAQRSYDKLGLLAALEHGGDVQAAVRVLAAAGHGEQRPARPAPDDTGEPDTDCAELEPPADDCDGTGDPDEGDPWDDPDFYAGPVADDDPSSGPLAATGRVAAGSPIDSLWRPVTLGALTTRPAPRRWLLRHPDRDGTKCAPGTGDGLLTRGIVGLLSAAGGEGKTMALCALAASVATGRPWLGHFAVDRDAQPGRVLLVLGEETADEVDRRLYRVARHYRLDADELQRCAAQIVSVPLAGVRAPLVGDSGETPHMHALRRRLVDEAGPNGWSLIAIDPLARLCTGDAESDNTAATELLQSLETLTAVAGRPTVLLAAHSSKLARRLGQVDSRGVTGLTDAARWHATLRSEGEDVMLELAKSNYSRPMPEPLRLARVGYGLLRERSEAEQLARDELVGQARGDRTARDAEAVVAYLRGLSGPYGGGIDALARAAGLSRDPGRAAVAHARAQGLLTETGTTRDRSYSVAPAAVQEGAI